MGEIRAHSVDARIGGLPARGQPSGLKLRRDASRSNAAPTHRNATGDSDTAHRRSHSRLSLIVGEAGAVARSALVIPAYAPTRFYLVLVGKGPCWPSREMRERGSGGTCPWGSGALGSARGARGSQTARASR